LAQSKNQISISAGKTSNRSEGTINFWTTSRLKKKFVWKCELPSKKGGHQKPLDGARKKQGLCFLTKALFKVLSVGLKDHLPPNDPGNLK
jgi:hypothetical protein